MTPKEIGELVEQHLGDLASKSGSVLYTSSHAIRPGPFYLMGFNPGGDPGKNPTPIGQVAERPPSWSAYTHDCWLCDTRPTCSHTDEHGRLKPEHLGRHQRNVVAALSAVGVSPGDIVSANAIFARSKDAATLKGLWEEAGVAKGPWDWWWRCWPVHQAFLTGVRPTCILTLGKGLGLSAFAFLRERAKSSGVEPSAIEPVGKGATGGRTFVGDLALGGGDRLSVRVVGLPHPSYYAPGQELSEFLRGLGEDCRQASPDPVVSSGLV